MSKKNQAVLTILIIVIIVAFDYLMMGRTFIHEFPILLDGSTETVVEVQDDSVIEVLKTEIDDGTGRVVFRGLREGESDVEVTVYGKGGKYLTHSTTLYVHQSGIITMGGFIGTTNRFYIIGIETALFFVLAFIHRVIRCRKIAKKSMYSYSLVGNIGVALFLFACAALFVAISIRQGTSYYTLDIYHFAFYSIFILFAIFAFPVVILFSIYLMLSNVVLLKKEGFSPENCLCILLALVLILMTLIGPYIESLIKQEHLVSILRWRLANHVEVFFYAILCYLECILVSTIFCAERAGKYVPRRNKDYIIILGCGLKSNGELTPLLAGRADRAVWFAEKQKKETGNDIIFVASGGQGSDEPISEGEAIKKYLMEKGVDPAFILVDDKSVNTDENMKLSHEQILKNLGDRGMSEDTLINIAYSTTDYHVLRSGVIAENNGFKASGVGSKTKWYFHINALIREFVAILSAEKKVHIRNAILLLVYTIILFIISTSLGILS